MSEKISLDSSEDKNICKYRIFYLFFSNKEKQHLYYMKENT